MPATGGVNEDRHRWSHMLQAPPADGVAELQESRRLASHHTDGGWGVGAGDGANEAQCR